MKHDLVFFLSSENMAAKNQENIFFDGYAFVSSDIIIGMSGLQQYQHQKGKCTLLYEDGNYVLIEKTNNGYKLTRDFHGYYPLFYYQSDEYWCISNSILYIIDIICEKRLPLSINDIALRAWNSKLSLTLQLFSFDTIINEIKVVPSASDISINKSKNGCNYDLHIMQRQCLIEEREKNYESALTNCLSIWDARYRTILENKDIALFQDLTGGLDSRTVLSFLSKNKELLKKAIQDGRIRINSDINQEKDYAISQKIAKYLEISLNTPIETKYLIENSSNKTNYTVWKYFNVGRYSPIIFPLSDFNQYCIQIGGEGGEDNRPFYGKQADGRFIDFKEYLSLYKKFFRNDSEYSAWTKSIFSALSLIDSSQKADLSILHYREFRSTHHTSKNPRSRFKVGVLGSKYFSALFKSNNEKILSNDILYEIIQNNDPALLDISFDSEYKTLTPEHRSRLVKLQKYPVLPSGEIYFSKEEYNSENSSFLYELPLPSENLGTNNKNNPLSILVDNALQSMQTNKYMIDYYFGETCYTDWMEKIQSINKNSKRINLHSEGYFLHTITLISHLAQHKIGILFKKYNNISTFDVLNSKYLDAFALGNLISGIIWEGNYSFAQWIIKKCKQHNDYYSISIKVAQLESAINKAISISHKSRKGYHMTYLKKYEGSIHNLDGDIIDFENLENGKYIKHYSKETINNFEKDFIYLKNQDIKFYEFLRRKHFDSTASKIFPLRLMVLSNAKCHDFSPDIYSISNEQNVYDPNNAANVAQNTTISFVKDKLYKYIEKAFILPIDVYSNNYYHNLSECFWGLRYFDYNKYDYPIIYTRDTFHVVDVISERLHIARSRFLSFEETADCIIKKAFCFYRGGYFWDISFFDFAKKLKKIHEKPFRRVYISRLKGTRALSNELELENFLKKQGFEIIYPEQLTFAEQIDLFSETKLLIAPHGAGITNILFMNSKTYLIEIFSENYVKPDYYMRSTHNDMIYRAILTNNNRIDLDTLNNTINSL